ncbi:LL-diaminopimelate aminotransferase [Caldinitratiruptor microaerophilus]|uniref:Aminotransferase n=1 Tax=Caldinitratiruptor microaerophilus TaxID=671077 RepID=A0AA35G860_9FIRM|nr:LL-diaminopimelate aminotransferase [Caldinitratiruptor microaerophilus]BDG60665.1 LL-diaminopimelate aminotransferase [Caldinitratiruptor microaerophilus]
MPRPARRIESVPPYLFAEIDRKRREVAARGVDVISLGIGDPDLPTPDFVVERMAQEIRDPRWHRYPDYEGHPAFRRAVASFYRRRFGVEIDPDREVLALIGSKEGLAHLIWAYVDPGDVVLVPDPAYPVYLTQTRLAGGEPYVMPLRRERGFLPDLGAIPTDVARRAKLLFVNYPNNPTGAVADRAFYEEAVAFCRQHDILLVSDNAYSEMTFDGFVAPSALEVPGARDVTVEFWSLSKPFNMTGWRIAAAVGNADALYRALGIVKTNLDSGQFTAIQMAAAAALESPEAEAFIRRMNAVYARRRDMAVQALRRMGLDVEAPRGTFYLWVPVPAGHTSTSFATLLLEKAGVVVTPGIGYGPGGEGYVRLSLCLPDERLQEALDRMTAQVRIG